MGEKQELKHIDVEKCLNNEKIPFPCMVQGKMVYLIAGSCVSGYVCDEPVMNMSKEQCQMCNQLHGFLIAGPNLTIQNLKNQIRQLDNLLTISKGVSIDPNDEILTSTFITKSDLDKMQDKTPNVPIRACMEMMISLSNYLEQLDIYIDEKGPTPEIKKYVDNWIFTENKMDITFPTPDGTINRFLVEKKPVEEKEKDEQCEDSKTT